MLSDGLFVTIWQKSFTQLFMDTVFGLEPDVRNKIGAFLNPKQQH